VPKTDVALAERTRGTLGLLYKVVEQELRRSDLHPPFLFEEDVAALVPLPIQVAQPPAAGLRGML